MIFAATPPKASDRRRGFNQSTIYRCKQGLFAEAGRGISEDAFFGSVADVSEPRKRGGATQSAEAVHKITQSLTALPQPWLS
jgi:hypothetical protein